VIHKKFALIGMDACLMSMFEVFYQIKDCADFFVTSEDVELAQGWNYKQFLHNLTTTKISAKELAEGIVTTFEDFYKEKTKFYTQSAIDLAGVDALRQNLDQIVENIIVCQKSYTKKINNIVKKARKSCFQLSVPCYVDLYSFYYELYKELNNNNEALFYELKNSLAHGIELINAIVIANVNSNYFSGARGISIYYPNNGIIDPSYHEALFVQDSLWLSFLEQVIK
jgi:hypothetical protein